MDYFQFTGQTEESIKTDERARFGLQGWNMAVKNHVPRIEWDEYAKSYVITLKDRCYYWNPKGD